LTVSFIVCGACLRWHFRYHGVHFSRYSTLPFCGSPRCCGLRRTFCWRAARSLGGARRTLPNGVLPIHAIHMVSEQLRMAALLYHYDADRYDQFCRAVGGRYYLLLAVRPWAGVRLLPDYAKLGWRRVFVSLRCGVYGGFAANAGLHSILRSTAPPRYAVRVSSFTACSVSMSFCRDARRLADRADIMFSLFYTFLPKILAVCLSRPRTAAPCACLTVRRCCTYAFLRGNGLFKSAMRTVRTTASARILLPVAAASFPTTHAFRRISSSLYQSPLFCKVLYPF